MAGRIAPSRSLFAKQRIERARALPKGHLQWRGSRTVEGKSFTCMRSSPGLCRERMKAGKVRWRARLDGMKRRKITVPIGSEDRTFEEQHFAARAGQRLAATPVEVVRTGSPDDLREKFVAWMQLQVKAGTLNALTPASRITGLAQACECPSPNGKIHMGTMTADLPRGTFAYIRDPDRRSADISRGAPSGLHMGGGSWISAGEPRVSRAEQSPAEGTCDDLARCGCRDVPAPPWSGHDNAAVVLPGGGNGRSDRRHAEAWPAP